MADSIPREEQTVLKSSADTELASPPAPVLVSKDGNTGSGSLTGQVFLEKYELREILGTGAWSTVYKGWHARLNKAVAVKCLHPNLVSTVERLRRFELEAKTAGALNHGNIVRVYDYGCYKDNQPFTVMEFIDGPTLAAVIETGTTLSLDRCALIGLQIAEALGYAHVRGVVHRDIKPENILIERTAKTEVAKLTDFGIVKAVQPEDGQAELTQTGEIVGTPQYMSPEQCSGKSVDGRSDIYSLGCLMYECLSGRHPFSGKTTFDCMRKHLEESPAALYAESNLPADKAAMQTIILSCLEKQPSKRPSAAQLSRMLQAFRKGEFRQIARALKSVSRDNSKWYLQRQVILASLVAAGICSLAAAYILPAVNKPKSSAVVSQAVPADAAATTNNLQSYETAIKLAFREIEYGIAHSNGRDPAETRRLESELNKWRQLFDSGKGSFPAASPVQVVSIGRTGLADGKDVASVIVSYSGSPVTLLLRSKTDTKWSIDVKPGANVNQIYVLGPEGRQQEIVGAPSKVPIKLINESGELSGVGAYPEYNDRAGFLHSLERIAGQKVASYQGKQASSAAEPWFIGPESKEWRAQMILAQLGPLHAEAMRPAREQVLQWLAAKPVMVSFAGSKQMHNGQLVPPKQAFDFVPGTIAGSWKPQPEQSFKLAAVAVRYPTLPYTQSKIVCIGMTPFALCAEGVLKLRRDGKPTLYSSAQEAGKPDQTFDASDYDVVYASGINSLLVKDRQHFYHVDGVSGRWRYASSIRDWSDRANKSLTQTAPFLQGMAYSPKNNSLYFLDKGGDSGPADVAHYLTRYSVNGEPLDRQSLTCRVPLRPSGSDGFTQMYFAQPYLLAVSSAPYESGSSFDRTSFMMREQDPRRYIWIMDPETGTVIMSAPLESNSIADQQPKSVGD